MLLVVKPQPLSLTGVLRAEGVVVAYTGHGDFCAARS